MAKFVVRQRVLGFDVPVEPWFDSAETTKFFLDRLAASTRYLEFGTGGSTYTAAKLGVDFIAVDSDKYFLRSVRRKIQKDGLARPSGQTFRHADIGPTGPWGRPIGDVTPQRRQLFSLYSDPPAESFVDNVFPDLVLVDGRFRVACALKAIRLLKDHSSWTLLVDDYIGRPDYHVIAEFAQLDRCVGRMGVFGAPKKLSVTELQQQIDLYEQLSD